MHQYTGKKKKFLFLFFIILFLSSINSKLFVEKKNSFYNLQYIEVKGLEKSLDNFAGRGKYVGGNVQSTHNDFGYRNDRQGDTQDDGDLSTREVHRRQGRPVYRAVIILWFLPHSSSPCGISLRPTKTRLRLFSCALLNRIEYVLLDLTYNFEEVGFCSYG